MIGKIIFAVAMTAVSTDAFTVTNTNRVTSTKLFLKDSIADMIDAELNRLQHKQEIKAQIQAKIEQEKAEMQLLPTNYEFNEDFETSTDFIVRRKDQKMAMSDPQRYCADRCISTGNCDVYEDLYQMDAMEVMEFCTECVLSEEEEACDVPDAMLDNLTP